MSSSLLVLWLLLSKFGIDLLLISEQGILSSPLCLLLSHDLLLGLNDHFLLVSSLFLDGILLSLLLSLLGSLLSSDLGSLIVLDLLLSGGLLSDFLLNSLLGKSLLLLLSFLDLLGSLLGLSSSLSLLGDILFVL